AAAAAAAAAKSLDFGSGGDDWGAKTHLVWVTNEITAYPFTVKQGPFLGRVGIYPSSIAYPTDGSEIRMWWSKEKGGEPLPGVDCNPSVGRLSSHFWVQTGTDGYGCEIDNVDATLYLNLQSCISVPDDTTCTAADTKPGSRAPIYIGGVLSTVKAR
ncbi:MAG: hypothetical protein P8N17_02375, partial [Luminiphilus sp.]|nr:hypothetical protein [Luminiphilus sp.]